MRKRKSEHKRDIETQSNKSPEITPILLTTCFVCMNRFPSPLGLLSRMIGTHTIAVRICVSCQKNMSLYNGISTSSFTHITEDPEGRFYDNDLGPLEQSLRQKTNAELIEICERDGISFNKKLTKDRLVENIMKSHK